LVSVSATKIALFVVEMPLARAKSNARGLQGKDAVGTVKGNEKMAGLKKLASEAIFNFLGMRLTSCHSGNGL